MDFEAAYPAILYKTAEDEYDAYGPPIPAKPDDSSIRDEEVGKVGSYPDRVVKSIAGQRDKADKKLNRNSQQMKDKILFGRQQERRANFWQEKYRLLQEAPEEPHKSTGSEDSVDYYATDSENNSLNGSMD